ncbi:hypothetical protein [Geobacter sp. DSM 9736]|uniref:hypothetical protein n=1 Tax=Geobacter sp. DSM 9736 TaxID=1277350 RepID=UPI000B5052A9|nr:hypothetical protein [Geobacter sp. DSM 9736]SNB45487.1 hypothetical protein SAMN06269301_0903 [Geobacter sp. DSM 9736]
MKKEHEDIKPFTKKLILPVFDNNDFFEGADYAIVELSAGMIERIRKLAEAVRNLDVYRISEFNYACDFRNADYEQWECGKVPLKEYPKPAECNLLNVTDTGFYWSGLYKNTEVRWSTDTVLLTTLDDVGDYDQREEYPDDEQIAMGV